MELTQAQLEAIIKGAVADALATFASGGPKLSPTHIVGDTRGPWVPGSPAKTLSEADRNACSANGRDAEGFRHRNRCPSEITQFEGSLDDAEQELKAAHLWQGDYLDFGPDQTGDRFTDWKSVREPQELRGLVVRYVLITNLIPTAAERKLSPFAAPQFDEREAAFAVMTTDDLWSWIVKQRGLTGSASGNELTEATDLRGGGGGKA